MLLPNIANADIDLQKLADYVLNTGHPEGRHKARVFLSALDVTASHATWLASAIRSGLSDSNFLLQHAWGADLVHDEMIITGAGNRGRAIALAVAADKSLASDDSPKPGEGPSRAEREAGSYDVLFVGTGAGDQTLKIGVTGDRDPGYGSTSKMIAEAAMCLLHDARSTPGGISTPASAPGHKLIARLQTHAGLAFSVDKGNTIFTARLCRSHHVFGAASTWQACTRVTRRPRPWPETDNRPCRNRPTRDRRIA